VDVKTFRAKYKGKSGFSGYPFDQERLIKGGASVFKETGNKTTAKELKDISKIKLSDNEDAVDVSDGACREFCRRWVQARNTPEIAHTARGDNQNSGQPKELAYLFDCRKEIVIRDALVRRGITDDSALIPGLARTVIRPDTVGALYDKLMKGRGTLAMVSVKWPTGFHMIAFDTRGCRTLTLFDPNHAQYWIDAGRSARDMVKDYFTLWEFALRLGYRFARC